MMFSTKAEYGVRVMVELARRAGETTDGSEQVVPLAEIAEHDGMPLAYLEHLVARLRKAGLVDSRRGSRGGYLLARPAEQIAMAEVVEALEGTIAPIECISEGPDGKIVCSREADPDHSCPTKLLWTKVRFSIVSTLQQTTLADLLAGHSSGLADQSSGPAGQSSGLAGHSSGLADQSSGLAGDATASLPTLSPTTEPAAPTAA